MGLIGKGEAKISQVAENIAGSEYWKKIAPGMQQLQKEVGERVMQNRASASVVYGKTSVDQASTTMARIISNIQGKGSDGVEELAKKISTQINEEVSDVNELFAKYSSVFDGIPKDRLDKIKEQISKTLKPEASKMASSPEDAYKSLKFYEKLVEVPKTYFTNPDKDIRNARIGAAAGAYIGASIGGRYLTGGTLTRDNYGRRDIAGVPFI